MSSWNGHLSTSLQSNQKQRGCALTLQDMRSSTSTNLHLRDSTHRPSRRSYIPVCLLATLTTNISTAVISTTFSYCEGLYAWATANYLAVLFIPKEAASFSHWWNVCTILNLIYAIVGHDNRLTDRRVLGRLPPSHIDLPSKHLSGSRFLPTEMQWSAGAFTKLIGSTFALLQMNPLWDFHLFCTQPALTNHQQNSSSVHLTATTEMVRSGRSIDGIWMAGKEHVPTYIGLRHRHPPS